MNQELKKAARKLHDLYRDEQGLNGVGITDKEIIVYVKKKKDGKDLPKTFEGFPVRVEAVGIIRFLNITERSSGIGQSHR